MVSRLFYKGAHFHQFWFNQVLYWIKPQHLLRSHPKLLLARNSPIPGCTCSTQYWSKSRRTSRRESLCQVRSRLPQALRKFLIYFFSSPVGVFPKPENCVFVPVPCELRFHQAERSGIDLLTQSSSSPFPTTDLEILERSIHSVSSMLDRVLSYVRSVLSGEKKGDPAVGRYLMDTLGASTGDLEKGGFNASLQVRLDPFVAFGEIGY